MHPIAPGIGSRSTRWFVIALMAGGRVLGVDVVKHLSDPEAGDYGAPEYQGRLGRVRWVYLRQGSALDSINPPV